MWYMKELSYSNLIMSPLPMGLPLLTRQSFIDSLLNTAGLTREADAKSPQATCTSEMGQPPVHTLVISTPNVGMPPVVPS